MADRITPAQRSALMAKIRSKDTKPELAVRSMVHRAGYRYRLYRSDLPGKPDLVFPARRKVIFVHGCFWHQQGRCRLSRPASNVEFWEAKFARNKKRDRSVLRRLRRAGWSAYVVWECKLKDRDRLLAAIERFLDG